MESVYDVRQLLKRFGTFIYIGNRQAEYTLMEHEVADLYHMQFISVTTYQKARLILRKEAKNIQGKGE